MNKLTKNIIRVVIGFKVLMLCIMLVSIVAIGQRQFNYYTSDFPEHKDFAKEMEGAVLAMLFFSLPLILSLIVDYREQKEPVLRGKWYLLTFFLIALYISINQFRGYHYLSYIITLIMIIVIALAIRKQKLSQGSL